MATFLRSLNTNRGVSSLIGSLEALKVSEQGLKEKCGMASVRL